MNPSTSPPVYHYHPRLWYIYNIFGLLLPNWSPCFYPCLPQSILHTAVRAIHVGYFLTQIFRTLKTNILPYLQDPVEFVLWLPCSYHPFPPSIHSAPPPWPSCCSSHTSAFFPFQGFYICSSFNLEWFALDISTVFSFQFIKVSGHVHFLKENFLDHQSKTAITPCSLSAFSFPFFSRSASYIHSFVSLFPLPIPTRIWASWSWNFDCLPQELQNPERHLPHSWPVMNICWKNKWLSTSSASLCEGELSFSKIPLWVSYRTLSKFLGPPKSLQKEKLWPT